MELFFTLGTCGGHGGQCLFDHCLAGPVRHMESDWHSVMRLYLLDVAIEVSTRRLDCSSSDYISAFRFNAPPDPFCEHVCGNFGWAFDWTADGAHGAEGRSLARPVQRAHVHGLRVEIGRLGRPSPLCTGQC